METLINALREVSRLAKKASPDDTERVLYMLQEIHTILRGYYESQDSD